MAQRRTAKKEAYFKLRLTTALFILKKQESFIKSKEFKNSGLTIRKKCLQAQRRTPKKEAYFKLWLTTTLFILMKQKSFIKSKEFKTSELMTGKKMLASTKNSKERSSNLFLLQMQVRLNLFWSKSHYLTALTSWFLLTFFVHYRSHYFYFF